MSGVLLCCSGGEVDVLGSMFGVVVCSVIIILLLSSCMVVVLMSWVVVCGGVLIVLRWCSIGYVV